MTRIKLRAAIAAYLIALGFLHTTHAATLEWVRQLGTPQAEVSHSISADGLGNIYMTGVTGDSLGGPKLGATDAFVSKYDAAGNLQWITQLGTPSFDISYGISADQLGNVFVTGYTLGREDGTATGFPWNVFVANLDASGAVRWMRYLATSSPDEGFAISADGLGNAYVAGRTAGSLGGTSYGSVDAFLSKIDANGSVQWFRQIGSSHDDEAYSVSADGLGNVYLGGVSNDDAFVSKYNAAGEQQWTQQFGTTWSDTYMSIAADKLGNVFVAGVIDGTAGAFTRPWKPIVRKYDAAGHLQWSQEIEAGFNPYLFFQLRDGLEVSTDGLGNVFVSGYVGESPSGYMDAFVSKYDELGNDLWTMRLGTAAIDDFGFGVSADGLGNAYITGFTHGSLGGQSLGNGDAFIAKFRDEAVPEPAGIVSAVVGVLLGAMRRCRFPTVGVAMKSASRRDAATCGRVSPRLARNVVT